MRNKFLSSLAGAVFSFTTGGFAFAADMAVKSPAPAPAPVYNWTGWYAGVNAGASMGNVKTDFGVPVTVFTSDTTPAFSSFNTPGTFSDRQYPDGFIGGGQIGYNWQYSPVIVVGLEADIQGAIEKDSNTVTSNFSGQETPPFLGIVAGSTVVNYQTKIDWFGTVRGRIGYVWGNGDVMSYITGGLAYGRVGINGTNTTTSTSPAVLLSVTQAFGHSQVNTGWTIGYGTEGRLAGMPGWTWKVEGLYMDLGTVDATGAGGTRSFVIGAVNSETVGLTVGGLTAHSHFTDGILRGGLNYKFY